MKHNIVICTQQPWGEQVQAAVLRVWQTGDPISHCLRAPRGRPVAELIEYVAARDPHCVFFVHWSDRIPAAVFDQWECVNFHCTPLPYGRGGNPIENMIRRGFTETVMTAHRVTGAIDAGPIYGTAGPISLAGPRAAILDRFIEPVAGLIGQITHGELAEHSQDEWGHFDRWTTRAFQEFWANRT